MREKTTTITVSCVGIILTTSIAEAAVSRLVDVNQQCFAAISAFCKTNKEAGDPYNSSTAMCQLLEDLTIVDDADMECDQCYTHEDAAENKVNVYKIGGIDDNAQYCVSISQILWYDIMQPASAGLPIGFNCLPSF